MKFRRKYSRFKVSRRYCRTLNKLIAGCAEVRTLKDAGSIITAEKKYNKKLCFYYGECRHLLKRRAEELAAVPDTAVAELDKIRDAFLAFYALAEEYGVDIEGQKTEALSVIAQARAIYAKSMAEESGA